MQSNTLDKLQSLFPIHHRAGNILLLNADCMDVMAQMEDGEVDLAITDPPYGIKQLSVKENRDPNSKFRRSMAAIVEGARGWNAQKPTKEYFDELFRVSKEQIIWGANNFSLPETEYFCIWNKQQTISNFASAEYAWVSHNQWKKPAKVFTYSIHATNAQQHKIHPTQKPFKLYFWLLRNYSKPGQKVFDSHLGSGSSAIAAHYFGVDFVGCEIDPAYHAAAVERFDNETRQVALI